MKTDTIPFGRMYENSSFFPWKPAFWAGRESQEFLEAVSDFISQDRCMTRLEQRVLGLFPPFLTTKPRASHPSNSSPVWRL